MTEKKAQAPASKGQLILDLVVNGLLPWAGYVFLQSQYGWSDYHALLAVTVIPGFFALVGIVRKGRPDLIASVSLVTILLSLALAAATHTVLAAAVLPSLAGPCLSLACWSSLTTTSPSLSRLHVRAAARAVVGSNDAATRQGPARPTPALTAVAAVSPPPWRPGGRTRRDFQACSRRRRRRWT